MVNVEHRDGITLVEMLIRTTLTVIKEMETRKVKMRFGKIGTALSCRKGVVFAMIGLILLAVSSSVLAAEFCVDTADQLMNALYSAETNQQDDIVKIVRGTYDGNFSFYGEEGRSLTLKGGYAAGCGSRVGNPEKTILDGGHVDNTLYIRNTVGGNINISHLTIRNGEDGGLRITENTANVRLTKIRAIENDGQGAFVAGGKTVSVESSIFGNNVYGGMGVGGVERFISRRCTYSNNTHGSSGAGLAASGEYIELTENNFLGNRASNAYAVSGGGAYLGDNGSKQSEIIVSNNTFKENSSVVDAALRVDRYSQTDGGSVLIYKNKIINNHNGGIGVNSGTSLGSFENVTISKNIINNNSGYGGGLHVSGRKIGISNNIVANNYIDMWNSDHAAISVYPTVLVKIINNTITRNTRTNEGTGGGGLGVWLYNNITRAMIYNNIIWGNEAKLGADIYINNDADGDLIKSPVELFNNDFNQAKSAGFHITRYIPIDSSNLNNVDPLFLDPDSLDFHLQEASPVIDKGNSNSTLLPKTDYEGDDRLIGPAVDLGADEFK